MEYERFGIVDFINEPLFNSIEHSVLLIDISFNQKASREKSYV
jgi:hypothetical protein